MIKAIIFDLNGVFVKSDEKLSVRFKSKFGVSENDFLPALEKIMAKIRMPNAGDAFSYWKTYLDKWNISLSQKEFFNFWFNAEKEVSDTVALSEELKNKGLRLFILSNNFSERAEYYDRNFPSLRKIADKIYYSWQTGFIKPNPEAYKLILLENNLKPDECLYFDDSEKNVEAANGLNIKSFLFEGIEKTKKIIKFYIL